MTGYAFLKIPKLSLVSCKGDCDDYSPEILRKTRQKVLSRLEKGRGEDRPRYIYISRQRAPYRKIANEESVTGFAGKIWLYHIEL